MEEAHANGPGRIYAGSFGGWGEDYRLWDVPVYAALLGYGADSLGFVLRTTSLSSDFEVMFNDGDPAQYDLFDVRYLILPSSRRPSVPATALDTRNGNTLWEVQTSGYLQVVDAVLPPIVADRGNLSRRAESFLSSGQLAAKQYPTVAFAGEPAAPPTFIGGESPPGPAGSIELEDDRLADGVVTAQIVANRPAMVVLKSSFDPRWQVVVDGVPVEAQMAAPSLVAREVPAGRHSIVFRYRPFPRYDVLFAIGVLSFAALWFGPGLVARRVRRRRRQGAE